MRKYFITVELGCVSQCKEIEAKNASEAREEALNWGHQLSNCGEGIFLKGVQVQPVVKSAEVK